MPTENLPDRSRNFAAMQAVRDEVFATWVQQVQNKVRRAEQVSIPVLIDTLPVFYDHIAALVSDTESTYDHSTLANEHGGERARLTHLDAAAVVHEMQLFRATVFSVWDRHHIVLNADDAATVNRCIDEGVRESVTGFVMMQTAFREQFFAALTHDMRTPLSTAMMAIELLGHDTPDERTQKLLATTARQHTILSQMVDDLLDTMLMNSADGAQLEFAEFDVMPLVRSVADDAALASGREINVNGEDATARWSYGAIRRALENLINNAIKYSDPDTSIAIEFSVVLAQRAIVSVTNTGPAIPADQMEAIFQLFRRSDKAKANRGADGWGIGLPYVRSVAERHAGSIGLESSERSTRFYLDMPLDPVPILQTVKAPPTPS